MFNFIILQYQTKSFITDSLFNFFKVSDIKLKNYIICFPFRAMSSLIVGSREKQPTKVKMWKKGGKNCWTAIVLIIILVIWCGRMEKQVSEIKFPIQNRYFFTKTIMKYNLSRYFYHFQTFLPTSLTYQEKRAASVHCIY